MNRPRQPSKFHLIIRFVSALFLISVIFMRTPASPATAYTGAYALNFDGVTDLVRNPNRTVDDIFGLTWRSSKIISVWVRPIGSPPPAADLGVLPMIIVNNPRWFGIARGIYSNQAGLGDQIWVFNFDNNADYIAVPFTVGEWVHITMVHTGGTLYAYKNGVLVGSTTSGDTGGFPPPDNSGGAMSFGGGFAGTNPPMFRGQIDEVAFYRVPATPPAFDEALIRDWMYKEMDASFPHWDDLAAYYKMSNGSGTTVTNDRGNSAFNGTMLGSPDWITSGAFAGPRNGLAFNGSDESVDIPDNFTLDMTSSFTFETWVNPGDWNNGSDTPIAVKGDGATPDVNYYFGKSNSGAMRFYYTNGASSGSATDSSGVAYTNGTWYHLAYVVDTTNNAARFYRNGELLSQQSVDFTTTPLDPNNYSLTFAKYPNSSEPYFSGSMDEVRLWSGARTATEIQEDMLQTLKGNESGLQAYYRFDQYPAANQTVLYDLTTNQLDGSLVNLDPADPGSDWTASTAFNTWIGGDSVLAGDGGNWSRNSVPGAADHAGVYNYAGGNSPILNTAASLDTLMVGTGATLTASSSGALSVANSAFVHGTVNLTNAGTLSAQDMDVASGASLAANTGGSLAVTGVLTNNGRLSLTQGVSGSADVTFFNTGGYGGLWLNPNGDNLGDTTVVIRGNQDCTNISGETVRRCFDITPATPPTTGANLTFFFDASEEAGNACTSMNAYHHNGSTWVLQTLDLGYGVGGRNCASTPRSVRVTGVTSFSPFALDAEAPTAVTLAGFSVSAASMGMLLLVVIAIGVSLVALLLVVRTKHQTA